MHRLNRAEYGKAIRDLLACDLKPRAALPVNDSCYGFDNIGDLLSLSPALLKKYLFIARKVSRLAVGDLATKPSAEVFQPRRDPPRVEPTNDDLPFFSRGRFSFQYYFWWTLSTSFACGCPRIRRRANRRSRSRCGCR